MGVLVFVGHILSVRVHDPQRTAEIPHGIADSMTGQDVQHVPHPEQKRLVWIKHYYSIWHIILLYEEADRRYTGGIISAKYKINMQFVWN